MTPHFESVIGFDPDGIRRIYASTRQSHLLHATRMISRFSSASR